MSERQVQATVTATFSVPENATEEERDRIARQVLSNRVALGWWDIDPVVTVDE